jgi:hypothetical protein
MPNSKISLRAFAVYTLLIDGCGGVTDGAAEWLDAQMRDA